MLIRLYDTMCHHNNTQYSQIWKKKKFWFISETQTEKLYARGAIQEKKERQQKQRKIK